MRKFVTGVLPEMVQDEERFDDFLSAFIMSAFAALQPEIDNQSGYVTGNIRKPNRLLAQPDTPILLEVAFHPDHAAIFVDGDLGRLPEMTISKGAEE